MLKVYREGKVDWPSTLKYNTQARVPKNKRQTLKQLKDNAKRAQRDVRLAKFW